MVLILIHGHLLISAAIDHKAADHKAATSCRTPKRVLLECAHLSALLWFPREISKEIEIVGKRGTGEQGNRGREMKS